eukprot:CAMPEP_0114525544 /NCGR_PEP_ID=MMETSP0109-20121206/22491_1 /TAXON_ID=29199 /ORGANISM="Chlorarachnion reptans, Strain CCCM449" /LENGTH=106 /DNA_ID=CAMNT_0001707153 /DNA_START=174 /DNA_END=494 /DNA_ORIENTATION=-
MLNHTKNDENAPPAAQESRRRSSRKRKSAPLLGSFRNRRVQDIAVKAAQLYLEGKFGSVTAAARHHGINREDIYYQFKKWKRNGEYNSRQALAMEQKKAQREGFNG